MVTEIHGMRLKIEEMSNLLQDIRDEWYTRYQPLIDSTNEDEMAEDARGLHELLIDAVTDIEIAEGKLSETEMGLESFAIIANDAVL